MEALGVSQNGSQLPQGPEDQHGHGSWSTPHPQGDLLDGKLLNESEHNHLAMAIAQLFKGHFQAIEPLGSPHSLRGRSVLGSGEAEAWRAPRALLAQGLQPADGNLSMRVPLPGFEVPA